MRFLMLFVFFLSIGSEGADLESLRAGRNPFLRIPQIPLGSTDFDVLRAWQDDESLEVQDLVGLRFRVRRSVIIRYREEVPTHIRHTMHVTSHIPDVVHPVEEQRHRDEVFRTATSQRFGGPFGAVRIEFRLPRLEVGGVYEIKRAVGEVGSPRGWEIVLADDQGREWIMEVFGRLTFNRLEWLAGSGHQNVLEFLVDCRSAAAAH